MEQCWLETQQRVLWLRGREGISVQNRDYVEHAASEECYCEGSCECVTFQGVHPNNLWVKVSLRQFHPDM